MDHAHEGELAEVEADLQRILRLLAGVEPDYMQMVELMMARIDPMADAVAGGMNVERAERIELMMRDPKSRLVAEVAHRCKLPASYVREHWSDEDLAIHLATEAIRAMEKLAACPDCGVSPGEMFHADTGRELDDPVWRYELHDCPVCSDIKRLNEQLKDRMGDESAAYYRVVPRGEDDPVMDELPSL